VFSNPEVRTRLARNFVALRIDWEQGKHYTDKLGKIPGTGCQTMLDLDGSPMKEYGGVDAFASRYNRVLTPKILDEIAAKFPTRKPEPPLKIEWFLWPTERKGLWPAGVEDIANYARLPQAWIEGPMPAALRSSDFLRWHLRQFVWIRGSEKGESRVVIRRVREGLRTGLPTEIATVSAADVPLEKLGKALDDAWITYMKDRPRTARGYAENPAGKMFDRIKDDMIGDEEAIAAQAAASTLLAPGRVRGEKAPYLKASR
jgi:hypothetical protein